MGDQDMEKSLVLSIFKGENFVVKGGGSYRAIVRAKCADLKPDLALESGAVKLTPGNSEPEFNSQLAWSLSRRQLRELRSNRSTIRVSCISVEERTGSETEIGYVVLHVKDATTFDIGDVDPTKAKTYTLLGTKDNWRSLHPRLQMILQLEDLNREKHQREDNKLTNHNKAVIEKVEHDISEMPVINAAKLSETKFMRNENLEKFPWAVNEKDGYFQLGLPEDKDDLYVFNTTVISASYLHLLWDGRSPRKQTADNYFWQIKYTAYGCEIASEPFKLSFDDESRRTFIGDKATARIRTNGALFFEYLNETSLEFRVIRYQLGANGELGNEEVMGLCFASLAELTDPNKGEQRVSLEILSEWGTPRVVSSHEKPEVRVIFTLDAAPGYFTVGDVHDNGSGDAKPLPHRDTSLHEDDNEDNGSIKERLFNEAKRDQDVDDVRGLHSGDRGNEDIMGKNQHFAERVNEDIENISNRSNARRLLQFENENREDEDKGDGLLSCSSSLFKSPVKLKRNEYRDKPEKHKFSNGCNYTVSESEDSDFTSNKENLANILPEPGEYKVTIELTRFWLKSQRHIRDKFLLSYTHPPLGISDKDNPVVSTGEPMSPDFTDARQGFMIIRGEFTKRFRITKFAEDLLNEPLNVEFRRVSENTSSKCFASSMIPFGRIFSEKGHGQIWILEDAVDILKLTSNVKIGCLFFKILLSRDDNSSETSSIDTRSLGKQSVFFPSMRESDNNAQREYSRDPKKLAKVTEDLKEWRKTQEEIYRRQKEQKEAAYLKILSEEAAKRDAERENVMAKKLAELEKKEKELNRQRHKLEEKEESLKQFEAEVKDKSRQLAIDQETLQHTAKLSQKRLDEDHKIEVNSLNREIRGYKEEVEKLKTKLLLLEKKLETKESEIDSLIALKREQPDARVVERLKLLEQENKTLKNQLREANSRKEQYKKQSLALCHKLSRVQEERDQELKDQNENLRLQILASREHKEIKKERKAVQGLSDTLKALQIPKPNEELCTQGSHLVQIRARQDSKSISSKEDEIRRLTEERTKLLRTGAYNQFDLVIKELENKIVTLAKE